MSDEENKKWELKTTTEFVPATRALLRRQSLIVWHRTRSWISKGGFKAVTIRLAYVAAYLVLPVTALVKLSHPTLTIPAFLGFLWVHARKAWKDNAPQNMQFLERNYLERKFALSRHVDDMRRMEQMTPADVQSFREDVLATIAQYARDHRADWKGRSIFANLLVEDGDDLVVIARNEPHRTPEARYPKAQMAAAAAFRTGDTVLVGDLEAEWPDQRNKRYSSILVLPIYLEGKIAGALSLDSEEKYHFDGEADALRDCLLPYTTLVAWTLATGHVKQTLSVSSGGVCK
jgi:putative methionine-R-sulfoxide reductase with GAF domain